MGADGVATSLGTWGGAIGSFVPIIGTGIGAVVDGIIGGIAGAYRGHSLYDSQVAPTVRGNVIGEDFRDDN